ncbi:MAG: hypothetical protein Q4A32_00215 [Lachnospiraceae bacterium]|nr:hypothetical protein [Lachnospiraceae bacterium]
MGILFAILKTILFLILILLALILILVLLILFVPFRYSAEGVKEPGQIEARASVTWLLRFLTVEVGYGLEPNRGMTKDIRIFGISLFKVKKWLDDRKKGKAEKEAEKRRREKRQKLERMKTEDPERYERLKAEAMARKEEKKRQEAEAEQLRLEEIEKEEQLRAKESKKEGQLRTEGVALQEDRPMNSSESEDRPDPDGLSGSPIDSRLQASGTESECALIPDNEARGGDAIESTPGESGGDATGSTPGKSVGPARSITHKIRQRVSGQIVRLLEIAIHIPEKVIGIAIRLVVIIWRLPFKILEAFSGILDKSGNIFGKINRLGTKASNILDFLDDERTQEVLGLIKKQIFRLFRHILPKELNGYLNFGLGDPYMTGRTLATACVFYPLYGRTFRLDPDFEEMVFNGKANLKGRIYLFYILFMVLTILLNKNTRYVFHYIKSFNKEDAE